MHYNPLPYQGFCKLALNDGSTVELEGSGELVSTMIDSYKESIVSAEIGELCTSIGDSAFAGCGGLTSVTIPNSVTNIGDSAFIGCRGLTSITVNEGNTVYHSEGNCCMKGTEVVFGCKTSVIPSTATSIGNYAFDGCSSLTSITIPNSITSIGNYAFYGCNGLTSVTIPNNVTSIGNYVFYGCSDLTSIDIPNSVTSIGDEAFMDCSSLTSIDIPNSVTNIGDKAFKDCSSLTSVTSLATTAPTIQNSTFQNVKEGGTLTVPSGATGYDVWMSTSDYYLGKYNWTKVEQ